MVKPLCIDGFCGLGGWAEGFLSEGFEVVGYDIERHVYGTDFYPGVLILQSILELHGSMFSNANCLVFSPPCQEYSYMAMPWKRGKQIAAALRGQGDFPKGYTGSRTIEELNALFNACFRIQREAGAAAGRHIPMVVENVRGAIPWVGRSAWNYGSFHLWGDVPALMPIARAGPMKATGLNTPKGEQHICGVNKMRDAFKSNIDSGLKNARNWWSDGAGNLSATTSSHSSAREAASAQIAKIPFPLASHIARVYHP